MLFDMDKIKYFMAKKFEGGLFTNVKITHIGDNYQIQ